MQICCHNIGFCCCLPDIWYRLSDISGDRLIIEQRPEGTAAVDAFDGCFKAIGYDGNVVVGFAECLQHFIGIYCFSGGDQIAISSEICGDFSDSSVITIPSWFVQYNGSDFLFDPSLFSRSTTSFPIIPSILAIIPIIQYRSWPKTTWERTTNPRQKRTSM